MDPFPFPAKLAAGTKWRGDFLGGKVGVCLLINSASILGELVMLRGSYVYLHWSKDRLETSEPLSGCVPWLLCVFLLQIKIEPFFFTTVCDGVELATLIDGIKDHIGVEWKSLGRALQLNQTEVEAIEYDYRFSLKEQIFQLFHVWQMKEGEGATCEALIAALKKANLVGVLELLKGLFIVEQSGRFKCNVSYKALIIS